MVRCHRIVVASSDNAPRLHPRIRVEKGEGGAEEVGVGVGGGGGGILRAGSGTSVQENRQKYQARRQTSKDRKVQDRQTNFDYQAK